MVMGRVSYVFYTVLQVDEPANSAMRWGRMSHLYVRPGTAKGRVYTIQPGLHPYLVVYSREIH